MWLNLVCLWSGLALLLVVLWRTVRVSISWLMRRELVLVELYCAVLVWLSLLALVYTSFGFPVGWAPHPEYVLIAYPAAALLIVRHLLALRSTPASAGLWAVLAVHLTANAFMLVHIARYKIWLYP